MIKEELRIVIMGTPSIAATVLEDMIQDGFNIVALIAQPDKPVGRKAILQEEAGVRYVPQGAYDYSKDTRRI